MPIHLVRTHRWPVFPIDYVPEGDGLAALGGQLNTEVVLEAYSKGLFPWTGAPPIPWYSPDPRLVLFPDALHVSRSLRKTLRDGRFEVQMDRRFAELMRLCGDTPRAGQGGTWITPNMLQTYTALHEQGLCHSVEVLRDGALVGGLYGLALGAAFFGESMVALEPDASKVALTHLCAHLVARGYHFVDCQQVTGHLMRMGAVPIQRGEFMSRLAQALATPTTWSDAPG